MLMTSANSGTNWTIGVVENHPVKVGPLTVLLQIHIVDDALFKVLLRRLFFNILSCVEVSTSSRSHKLHFKDLVTGTPYIFPTNPHPNSSLKEKAKATVPAPVVNF